MFALLHGLALGLGLILPIGPQNAFVLADGARSRRYLAALPVAALAAACDTVLIAVGAPGAAAALAAAPGLRTPLVALAAGYLAWLGVSSWREGHAEPASAPALPSLRARLAATATVSLVNPHAILDTVGVIGAGALAYAAGGPRLAFEAGAALASWLWFPALSLAGHAMGRAVGDAGRAAVWLARVSAVLLWSVAVFYALSLLGR